MFDTAARALDRELPLIAEDLGVITPAVERLRDGLGLPGMVVLQFGFDPQDMGSPHNPWNHVEARVAYTGTHDHDTVRGWYESLPDERRALVDRSVDEAGVREDELWWSLIRLDVRLARAAGDGAGAGRPRARRRGAHEPAGYQGRLMALAADRAAVARPRAASARGRGGCGAG